MHGEKLSVTMQLEGYRTRQLKSNPQEDGTETVVEAEFGTDLTRAIAGKLGPSVRRMLEAENVPDTNDPDEAADAGVDGTVRPHVDGCKEPYSVTLLSMTGNGGAKTCSLRQQCTQSLRIRLGETPTLAVRLVGDHDERTLSFLRENIRMGVKIQFQAAQGRLV